jgi:hypothetical protein
MRPIIFMFLFIISSSVFSQSPKQRLALVNQKFAKVNDYSATIHLQFNLPSINMEAIDGKVFFKKPSRFRIKTKGIIFLPKQNPYYSLSALTDTNSYTAINSGEEKIGSTMTVIIQVLPNGGDNDLILGKFWIDKVNNLVLKSQLTTKSSGTIQMENNYGLNSSVAYALPDKMTVTVDMAKFKVPKMISADINAKSNRDPKASAKGTGVIILSYSGYAINQKLPDSVFIEQAK